MSEKNNQGEFIHEEKQENMRTSENMKEIMYTAQTETNLISLCVAECNTLYLPATKLCVPNVFVIFFKRNDC